MSRLVPGAVVWARVPFSDRDEYKIRPAVVCSVVGHSVTIRPCTTAPHRHWYGVLDVEDPGAAGLRRPTGVRRRAITVDILDIVGTAGCLSDDDAGRVLRGLLPHPPIGRAA
jgi:hypothetical protein